MYGLRDIHISKIRSIFKKFSNIDKAIIYGSRAKGNFLNGSDIDLTLIGESIDLTELQKIENELDDLLLPYKIDLSLFHKINNLELLDHIERVGIEFYKKKIDEKS